MEKTGKPFFTIITSTLNVIDTIERCVKSVAEQTFRDYEHIIVDGASTDGTVEFLNSRKELFSVLISEPDTGIYNAWNKALKNVRGEWVLFLGADDILADENVLAEVAKYIELNAIDTGMVYGDILFVRKGSYEEIECVSIPVADLCSKPQLGGVLPRRPQHPAVFHHRQLFFDLGLFDENFKILADSKFMIYAICQNKVCVHHVPIIINKMTVGGLSFRVGYKLVRENMKIVKELNLKPSRLSIAYFFFKEYLKIMLQRIAGNAAFYKIIDFIRSLKGKPPMWTK